MSQLIIRDSFAGAISPSPQEVQEFRSTLASLNNAMGNFAANFIATIKSQPEAAAIRANLDFLQFDFGNWWKHVICEHAEHHLSQNFGKQATGPVEMIDCRVDGNAMQLTFAHDGIVEDEILRLDQDMVLLTAYDTVTSQDGYKNLKSLCSQIGGLDLMIPINPHRPDSPTLLTPPKTGMIYVQTRDHVPLQHKIERFEEFGPMH